MSFWGQKRLLHQQRYVTHFMFLFTLYYNNLLFQPLMGQTQFLRGDVPRCPTQQNMHAKTQQAMARQAENYLFLNISSLNCRASTIATVMVTDAIKILDKIPGQKQVLFQLWLLLVGSVLCCLIKDTLNVFHLNISFVYKIQTL